MNYKLKILPQAKQDLKEIAIWYEEAQKGLGKRFLACVKAEMTLVKEKPLIFQTKYDNNKTILVNNFPYLIHYEIMDSEILVKAVLHTSRSTKKYPK
jgi:plasmid stabilization system protein ParE